MATTRSHIVRVEELSNGVPSVHAGVHFGESSILGPSPEYGKPSINVSMPPASNAKSDRSNTGTPDSGIVDHEEETDSCLADEAADVVFPLPEGWPKLPQLFQRRSWNFTTAVSPSLNKATSHLELLQNVIEEWFQEVQSEFLSRASSRTALHTQTSRVSSAHSTATSIDKASTLSTSSTRKQLRFVPSAASSTDSRTTATHDDGTSRVTAYRYSRVSQLSVYGLGATADQDSVKSTSQPKDEFEYQMPYLGAEDVMDEVILLLAHLENDRQETRTKLKAERERVRTLNSKTDRLSKQRITELPKAVQREHEACSMDINELNWHVAYRTRIEERIKNKVGIADVLNTRLKEDISFVKKHCPLVSEKLELEKEAMDRIKQAQSDTNDELKETDTQCGKVENKFGEANSKADAEREHMKNDMEAVNKELTSMREELSQAKKTHATYIHQCNYNRQQVESNASELIVLQVKEENTKVAEAMEAARVKDFQTRIVESEFEHRRLDDQNQQLGKEWKSNSASYAEREEQMRLTIDRKSDQLRDLKLKNQELLMDIDDHHSKIEKCIKQRVADEKNLTRMEKEMERTEESLAQTTDELGRVRVINTAVHDKLVREEDRCMQEEDTLRSTAEALRKQVKEEMHSRTVIQARISSDSTELQKFKKESQIKKEKMTRKAEEVGTLVKNILDKVMRLRAAHQDRDMNKGNLETQLSDLRQKKIEIEEWNDKQRKDIMPKHQRLKDDIMSHDKRLDHIQWKTDLMNKKIEEMDAAANMMSKSMRNSENAIKTLEEDLKELNIQIKDAQSVEDNLRISLNEIAARVKELDKNHEDLMESREEVHAKLQKDLRQNLQLNKELATRYRQLQNAHMSQKHDLLNKYDKRVKMESSVKDLKQVSILQKRMHSALTEYYNLRSLYNTTELERMERESGTNAQHVSSLQQKMDSALEHITHFLKTQLDGTEARRIAMEKVKQENTETLVTQAATGGNNTITQTSVSVQ